jgi:8-oxo-dGTP pyrophosphatase MutT (NUDIX family)
MVAVFDDLGRVLLIRHTYGDRRRWDLPGGWVGSDEPAIDAARREMAEEIGLTVELRPAGAIDADWEFKHEHLEYFAGSLPAGGRGSYDPVEIAEVGWFDPALPPPRIGRGTAVVLGSLRASNYPRDRA